tara:strand:- start:1997 stop:4414 length:2418 start_codon:yes stop_codon:yes gene_type:complete
MIANTSYFYSAFLFLLVLTSCSEPNSEVLERTRININKDWNYLENAEVQIPEGVADQWTVIDLPHTWNFEDVIDQEPGYRRDASWYKKILDIPKIESNKKYSLYFEGSNVTTRVVLNNIEVGSHIGGYLGFEIDITKAIKAGKNTIFVRVDNAYDRTIIPSQKSDFFIYGGITRDVWFISTSKNNIKDLKISTPEVSHEKATLKAVVALELFDAHKADALKLVLKNSEGHEITSKVVTITNELITVVFDDITNPKLWDTKNPNLYTVEASVLKNGKVEDIRSEKVGFRWFEFKDYGAFYLNGKRLLLRGTHRHEEHAGVGAAMSNEMHRKDMEQIKDMGANFVRLAHYPQDPEIYKACDELGILVWDELPWCRGGIGDDVWKKNTKNMLSEMINQNYNHPSIIIWSLGNELYWLPDYEGGDDTQKINEFLKELNTMAHQLDPMRKTALRKYYEGAAIVDVFSPSIWSGWYSGSYKSYQKAIDIYKPQYKHFLHAEYGGSSHVGRHTENPITGEGLITTDGWEEAIVQTKVANIAQIGDWSENYIVDLFDWYLRISETDSTFVGNVQWAFKDFGTPLRPENDIPYMNQKGLVDRNGHPKDAYYVFKSYWSDDPFTYIESHTWTERQGPKELPRTISVFSNCEKVTFYHNGKNLGTKIKDIKKFPASGLTWEVNFVEGENSLVASGVSKKGVLVSDTLNVTYRFSKNDTAKELQLISEKLTNGNYLVSAIAVDENGLRCLDYEDKVYFQCLSGGKLIENQGTPTGSSVIAMANGKASIEVIPYQEGTPVAMMVLNQNFKGTYLSIVD